MRFVLLCLLALGLGACAADPYNPHSLPQQGPAIATQPTSSAGNYHPF